MKIFKESLWILSVYMLGLFVSQLISPILIMPPALAGMLILFLALLVKIIKIEDVENVSGFLLANMSFFFIPLMVGIMTKVDLLAKIWPQLLIIVIVSTFLTMVVTAWITEIYVRIAHVKGNES